MRCDDKSAALSRAAKRKVRQPAGEIGPASQQRIGVHLRAMYQRVLSQPVPDRFTDLIARLEVEPPAPADGPVPDGPPSPRNEEPPSRRTAAPFKPAS